MWNRVFSVLILFMSKLITSAEEIPVLCDSPVCQAAATDILHNMDLSVDPCDNFYNFACGSFERSFNETIRSISMMVLMNENITSQIQQMLTQPSVRGAELNITSSLKNLFRNCMDVEKIEKRGTEPLLQIFKTLGGFPALDKSARNRTKPFNLSEMVRKMRSIGLSLDFLVDFSVRSDRTNSTRTIIELDRPTFGLASPNGRDALLRGWQANEVKNYVTYLFHILTMLGANPLEINRDITDVVNFEIELAKIMSTNAEQSQESDLINMLTLRELQQKYPWLNWTEYINNVIQLDFRVDGNEVVNILDPKYYSRIEQLLNQTSTEVLENFMFIRVTMNTIKYLGKTFVDLDNRYRGRRQTRLEFCTERARRGLPLAVSVLYVRNTIPESLKLSMSPMIDDIRYAFRRNLLKLNWMDQGTLEEALKKLEHMHSIIAYPPQVVNDTIINDYFSGIKLDSGNFFENGLALTKFASDKYYGKLRAPKSSYNWTYVNINNAYFARENHMLVPAGMLQGHFYHPDRPEYLNYAAVGSIVAHEITHAFDSRGSEYDALGNHRQWWHPKTRKTFKERSNCFVHQYGSIVDPYTNVSLNGRNTLDENIADNGGFKTAYEAYQLFKARRKIQEPLLPGLEKFNQNQMYWIMTAQNWCSKHSSDILLSHIKYQRHTVERYRVMVPMKNSEWFSKDFNCPRGSKMNPVEKCQIW